MRTSTNTNPPQLVLDPLHANARVNGKTCKMKKKKSDDGNDASVSVGFREDELVSSESDSGHSDVFVLHEL